MFLVSHGSFKDSRTTLITKAGELILSPARVDWFITRLEGAGCTDIVKRELSRDEHRARVRQTLESIR